MTILTKSSWFYGHTITASNRAIDFTRGSNQYTGIIAVGSYTLTNYAQAVVRAMNIIDTGGGYSATVNRATRAITILSDESFSLDITGPSSSISTYPLLGFTEDQSSATSHTGGPSGSEFRPQLELQDYTAFEDDQDAADSVINESASGKIESVSFGMNRFMTCNIRFQNNQRTNFTEYRENGIMELRNFLTYAATKADLEFMPNRDEPNTFFRCILDRTQRSQSGTGFRMTESQRVPGFFESGSITFRERT